MTKYYFYDTDICGKAEYDISGSTYEKLIQTCCRYSNVLCLKFRSPNIAATNHLQEFEIPKPNNILTQFDPNIGYCIMRYYRVCPELCTSLLSITKGIFEWLYGWGYKNPDDPIFYRSDGSIFFASEIHEGVCILAPRQNEDIGELLSMGNWIEEDERPLGPALWRSLSNTGDGSAC